MVEPPLAQAPQSAPIAADHAVPPANVWERLKHHKVLQWTLAYAAAAYTLMHATQMAAESFDWPHLVVRIVALVLVLGLPIVVLLSWYHGHKAQHRFSTAELSLLTVLLIIAGSILWALTRSPAEPGRVSRATVPESTAPPSSTAQPEAGETVTPPRASVAVVPFANLTGEADKEYFSDGMAEEMINSLANVPGLKVPARTSSFAYKGRNIDIRRIAADLGCATILEGSVRSAGTRIRVTAQLVDAKTGYHIWSESYDRQFTDVFKVQDELAAAIVSALSGYFDTTVAAPTHAGPPTQDVLAYQLYLQSLAAASGTEESLRQTIALLDQALARDPRFARALARRASTRLSMHVFGYPLPHALEDAERDAAAALTIDPRSAEAQDVAGAISGSRGEWIDAERRYRASLATAPSDPDHHANYARYVLQQVGRLRQAESELREAYRLAPASRYVVMNYSSVTSLRGFDSEALSLLNLAGTLGIPPNVIPGPIIRANAAVRSGRCAEGMTAFTHTLSAPALAAGGVTAQQLVCEAMTDPSRRLTARSAVLTFLEKLKVASLTPSDTAVVLELLTSVGALDQAYELANQSWELGIANITALWTSELHAFRRDGRFQAFVTRLKLPEYWKQYGPPDECDLRGDTLVCR
jgi:TolB-like protein/Flp pilus assembly protein TadD